MHTDTHTHTHTYIYIQALIWDLQALPRAVEDPILAYKAGAEVNQLQWSSAQPDWVAIAFEKTMQILRV